MFLNSNLFLIAFCKNAAIFQIFNSQKTKIKKFSRKKNLNNKKKNGEYFYFFFLFLLCGKHVGFIFNFFFNLKNLLNKFIYEKICFFSKDRPF